MPNMPKYTITLTSSASEVTTIWRYTNVYIIIIIIIIIITNRIWQLLLAWLVVANE